MGILPLRLRLWWRIMWTWSSFKFGEKTWLMWLKWKNCSRFVIMRKTHLNIYIYIYPILKLPILFSVTFDFNSKETYFLFWDLFHDISDLFFFFFSSFLTNYLSIDWFTLPYLTLPYFTLPYQSILFKTKNN